jgi:hypothetical protein
LLTDRCSRIVTPRMRAAGRDWCVDRGRPVIEAFAVPDASVGIAAPGFAYVVAQPELDDGVDVPPVVLELLDPLELESLRAMALAMKVSTGDDDADVVAFVVVPVEFVEIVAAVVVPELVVEVAAGAVVPVVLVEFAVLAVVVVPVDDVPVVLVDGTADK